MEHEIIVFTLINIKISKFDQSIIYIQNYDTYFYVHIILV